jgi:hypothetical protein
MIKKFALIERVARYDRGVKEKDEKKEAQHRGGPFVEGARPRDHAREKENREAPLF